MMKQNAFPETLTHPPRQTNPLGSETNPRADPKKAWVFCKSCRSRSGNSFPWVAAPENLRMSLLSPSLEYYTSPLPIVGMAADGRCAFPSEITAAPVGRLGILFALGFVRCDG
jgi:hypothetical protein